MKPGKLLVTTALLVLAWSTAAAAQTGAALAPPARAPGPVLIDMDADVIEGRLDQPDVVLIPPRTPTRFRSLIQMRKSFAREMLASVGQLGATTVAGK